MNPKHRIAQIDRLTRAIEYIGPDFEKFGGLFLDYLLEIQMNHQGTNLVGYPVSGVVDSVSKDDRIVAEYSDAEDYFAGVMHKAESDLVKALESLAQTTSFFCPASVGGLKLPRPSRRAYMAGNPWRGRRCGSGAPENSPPTWRKS
jgi:hypothetical protein